MCLGAYWRELYIGMCFKNRSMPIGVADKFLAKSVFEMELITS